MWEELIWLRKILGMKIRQFSLHLPQVLAVGRSECDAHSVLVQAGSGSFAILPLFIALPLAASPSLAGLGLSL